MKLIRVDVDGYYGLVEGVPNVLKLFSKYGIKATFFFNMGREAGLWQLLRYRSRNLSNLDKSVVSRYSLWQKLNRVFFPRWLGAKHCDILLATEHAGHEVEPHAWNHLLWTKNFNNIDVYDQLKCMKESFMQCFNKPPVGFAPPGKIFDDRVLDALVRLGYKYVCTNKGKKPTKQKVWRIPLTFSYTPEELLSMGWSKEKIISKFYSEMKKPFASVYFHADAEGRILLDLLEGIIKKIKGETLLYKDIIKE
ncbi:hypothetical protein DRN75_04280 [Nanoarchaeota archaeon]|nr:MAG: hypothetical protein DRN75_04280 [Nanoarchaeota archaeon]